MEKIALGFLLYNSQMTKQMASKLPTCQCSFTHRKLMHNYFIAEDHLTDGEKKYSSATIERTTHYF